MVAGWKTAMTPYPTSLTISGLYPTLPHHPIFVIPTYQEVRVQLFVVLEKVLKYSRDSRLL